MKKRLISILLVFVCIFSPVSAAFSDISDTKLARTAAVLDALGIMQGMGNNRFSPDTSLTRAQFCKLAVTALGFSDVTAYGSFTIFPDVKHTHWAAPYINAAVQHPDLKKQAIIRGYADGTFGPDKTVNFGEVCTMLLRMLGYGEQDVGPFWPADYIAKAQSLGLTRGVSLSNAKAAVKRSDAAVMLLNTLCTPIKDSDSDLLLNRVCSATVPDCILLETSDTDDTLAANQAIFYENGAVSETPRITNGTLDQSLIGMYGTIVIGKSSSQGAIGMIPSDNKVESYTVVSVEDGAIQTDRQVLTLDRNISVYCAREGRKLIPLGEILPSIQEGDQLTCYYNAYGTLELIVLHPVESPDEAEDNVK